MTSARLVSDVTYGGTKSNDSKTETMMSPGHAL